MRIAFLSTENAPLLCHHLQGFAEQGVDVFSLILDAKRTTAKNLQIFRERTEGRFPEIPLHRFTEKGLPAYFVGSHASNACADLVTSQGIDLLVNVGTPRILPSNVVSAPRMGTLNCHPGLLPQFRGCTCVEWAIFLDEQIGNTVHFMTEEIDRGPIILREGLWFDVGDTYADVRAKVYRHAIELTAKAVRRIAVEGAACAEKKPEDAGRYFRVIGEAEMAAALLRLAQGRYAFQSGPTRKELSAADA